MTHPGRLFGKPCGECGISRRDDRPAVDEDLRADLLGDGLAVDRDRTAGRRRNPALQIEPGRVLGGVAVSAPPEDRAALDKVVEPRLADLPRREIGARAVILERADECEGSCDVVVGDDQRTVQPLVDIVLDRAEFAHDPLIRPTLEGPPEIDANELAEHSRVSALRIVWRESRHRARLDDFEVVAVGSGGNGAVGSVWYQ